MYTIKLADGTELKHCELNGNNYIYETKVDDSLFKDNLSTVTITDEDTNQSTTYKDMKLVQNTSFDNDGKSWIVLDVITQREKTENEIELALAELYEMIISGGR